MKKKILAGMIAAIMVFSLVGCQSEEKKEETETKKEETKVEGTVTLAAAASLEYAFTEKLIPEFEKEYPDVKVEGVYDSSGKLQQQIEAGLGADIFFSAAEKQMNELNDEGMIDSDTILNMLENKIVLITPSVSDKTFASFEDIKNAGTVALGDTASVPVGQYSQEALTSLGLWEEVSAKASFGTNVTEVLNWVAEASADCGIVYATDAATTDKVKVVAEAPEGSLKLPVLYPVAITKDAPNPEAAKAFYDFITSDEASEVFESYGFSDYRDVK